jgi:diadenosine tetraphosphatase ApaH/serine/threonine PP2A family protein phosphatase
MRIGLLADLHANRQAMETCMAALEKLGCSHWVFLGDLVGYGGDPGWVIDRVRERVAAGAVAVLGNHDQAVVTDLPQSMSADTRAAILWTRGQLDASQLAFLRDLPVQIEEDDRLYVHANAWAPLRWGYVSNRLAATQSLAATAQWLTFCGHVHQPALYFLQASSANHFDPRAGTPIPLSTQRRWLAIPGSCGQPRDHNPAAACAWFDSTSRQLTFLRLPYDHDRAAHTIALAALPSAFAVRLLTGV